jgi:cytochrome c oxidase cbb3-type subunit 4
MDTYSLLREIADSWMLLAMFIFLIGCYVWAFLPSQRKAREDASLIPFRNDTPAEPKTNGAEDNLKGRLDV